MGSRPTKSRDINGRQQGFSLLELVVVIAIVAILAAVFLARMPVWQARAEMAAMESVLGALRSAIGMKVAAYIAANDGRRIRSLVGINPMGLLAEKPHNYQGEMPDATGSRMEGGQWYFDPASRMLVYRVQHGSYFASGVTGPARARFAVLPVFDNELPRSGRAIVGMQLAAVEPYRWRQSPDEETTEQVDQGLN